MVLAVVTVIVLLFVGLFAINTTGGLISDSEKLDYSYSTVTNSTVTAFGATANASHAVTLAAISSITGETATKTLTAIVENKNTTNNFTITTYLNNVSLGTFTALNGTNTTKVYSAVSFVSAIKNNLTYQSTALQGNTSIRSSAAYYPTGTSNTNVGDTYDDLTTNTNVVYDVIILVVIIFALAVAMGSLKVVQGAAGGTGAM